MLYLLYSADAQISVDTTHTPSSTTMVQEVPSVSTSPTTHETISLVIYQGVEEQILGIQVPEIDDETLLHNLTPNPSSGESSSQRVIRSNSQQLNQSFGYINKWSKAHPLENVIGSLSRPVSTPYGATLIHMEI